MINNNKQDDAMEMLSELSEKQENGDIYYLMSKIFELNDDIDSRRDCLEFAIENQKTLTFDINLVKNEYKEMQKG